LKVALTGRECKAAQVARARLIETAEHSP
jgi:hypothetical protein